MRILLADDQPEVRSAIRLVLEQEPATQISAEVADAAALLAQVERPDLLLLDCELPGAPLAAILAGVQARWPRLPVLALSGRPEARQAALAAGASAFVDKCGCPDCLLAALRALRDDRGRRAPSRAR